MRLIVAAVLIYIGIMQFVAMTQGGNAAFSILFGLLFIGVGASGGIRMRKAPERTQERRKRRNEPPVIMIWLFYRLTMKGENCENL